MKFDDFKRESDELVSKMNEETDPEKKAQLREAWWTNAVDCYNEEVAGQITLIDGRQITIPKI